MNGSRLGMDYKLGSTVTYQCDSGYTTVGPATLICIIGADGKPAWDKALPTCKGAQSGREGRQSCGGYADQEEGDKEGLHLNVKLRSRDGRLKRGESPASVLALSSRDFPLLSLLLLLPPLPSHDWGDGHLLVFSPNSPRKSVRGPVGLTASAGVTSASLFREGQVI
ncbi:hypothetical protein NFI96_004250 [Prochilodus magdalenae]|nr:hypothetical protein NFI96_004250 [Prochilodus magdalenae]